MASPWCRGWKGLEVPSPSSSSQTLRVGLDAGSGCSGLRSVECWLPQRKEVPLLDLNALSYPFFSFS